MLAMATFPATGAGVLRAMDWIGRRTGGGLDTLVEGIGSYGAQVAKAARRAG